MRTTELYLQGHSQTFIWVGSLDERWTFCGVARGSGGKPPGECLNIQPENAEFGDILGTKILD